MPAKRTATFIHLGGQKVFSLATTLFISVLLARALGPEDYGLYVFVSAFVPLAALPITGGLPQLLTREVAKHGEKASLFLGACVNGALRLSRRVAGLFLVLCTLGLFTFKPTSTASLICLCLLCVPFLAFEASYNGIIRGLKKPSLAEFPKQAFQPLVMVSALVLLVVLGKLNVTSAILALLIATVASTLCSWAVYRRITPPSSAVAPSGETYNFSVRAVASFSAIALFASLNAQIGILVLGWLDQTTGVAALRIAERAGQLTILPLTIVNLMIAPRIAAAWQANKTTELQRVTKRAGQLSFCLTLPALPIIWLYGDWLIASLFGRDYAVESLDTVIVLVAGQTVGLVFGAVWPLLIMTGHEREALHRLIASCGINLLLCLWLAPLYGAVGAALATCVSLIFWKLSFASVIKKRLGVSTYVV